MKNKLLIMVPVAVCFFAQSNAQTTNATASTTKEVIVNGIPYSEYAAQVKAQQAALNSQVVTPAKPIGVPVQGTIAADKPVTEIQPKNAATILAELKASQASMESRMQELKTKMEANNKATVPAKPVQETKPVYEMPKPIPGGVYALSLEKKAAATSTDPSGKQSPANNVKPVENLKYINSGPVAVPVAELKPVTTTVNAATGESVASKMGLTVAPVSAAITPVENAGTPVGVQAKIDNSKPVQIVEVPKSVPASKQPVTEKPKN